MSRRRIVIALSALSFIVFAIAAYDRALAQPDRPQQGQRVFMAQGCHGCHTVGKLGTPIGPDLSHVGVKYSESYFKAWLRDPAQQRPAAHMPQLELTDAQIALLAAFLASLQ